jgi:tRNA(fMet)-specific endonuclease VapC
MKAFDSDAFRWFQSALNNLAAFVILPWTMEAERQFAEWKSAQPNLGTRDLRIAAIAKTHNATLISRNRRELQQLPGLDVEFWG